MDLPAVTQELSPLRSLTDAAIARASANPKSKIQNPKSDAQKAHEVAQGFESILLQRLMEAMKASIPESGLEEDGADEQVKDLFWFQLSEMIARNGGLGLAKVIESEVLRQSGGQQSADASKATPRTE